MAEHNIHHFTPAVIPLFQNCEFCGEKIICIFCFGLFNVIAIFNSAYQCTQCLKFCHKQCCKLADSLFPCTGIPDSSVNQEVIFTAFPVNHTLAESTYSFFENFMKPSFLKRESAESTDPSSSQNGLNGSNGAQAPVNSSQHLPSFRSHPSQPELGDDDEDDDYDDLNSFESGSLNLSQSSDPLHPLRRSTFLEGSPAFDQDYSSQGQDDSILSYPGFFTVIVQQAMNISLPAVALLRLSHVEQIQSERVQQAEPASLGRGGLPHRPHQRQRRLSGLGRTQQHVFAAVPRRPSEGEPDPARVGEDGGNALSKEAAHRRGADFAATPHDRAEQVQRRLVRSVSRRNQNRREDPRLVHVLPDGPIEGSAR